ncbi:MULTISPECIES: LysE/ArgO family amino acid transporter [Mycobacteroides]|uniref:Amino acid transporter n=2 Tax=Mycobacteroides chelonae TaxID=1774 RepID=A0AB73U6Z1_MYCCH|nr:MULTISPECIES: LysE/ArgO family amino acid transporter [Mycobacteroides]PKQ59876.1 amino acid transporter [Mycobacterium sp. MHSD3]SKN28131.1 Putative transporter [Mycobacteroides abscessus subsp. bolletii]AYM43955.1 amino acid transporter [[Mycobacterium] chelonae subsp. gwanakae]MBF9318518.1 amino acid transporter [Mycobacteroides chelonae]MBF9329456.1 amino acid transporter [Mycobacteroides chelonae]
MTVLFLGFLTGMSLIAAIGAQNAFVLRQGIRSEYVLPVVAVCITGDFLLIAAGIGGLGGLIAATPSLLTVAKVGGAAFLICYGLLAARRALRPGTLVPAESNPARLGAVLMTALAITFLNPHVYLDTVVLLGSLANAHKDARWLFGAGALIASVVWFVGLGFGARHLAGLFQRPGTWRVLDAVIAVVMITLGLTLVV